MLDEEVAFYIVLIYWCLLKKYRSTMFYSTSKITTSACCFLFVFTYFEILKLWQKYHWLGVTRNENKFLSKMEITSMVRMIYFGKFREQNVKFWSHWIHWTGNQFGWSMECHWRKQQPKLWFHHLQNIQETNWLLTQLLRTINLKMVM